MMMKKMKEKKLNLDLVKVKKMTEAEEEMIQNNKFKKWIKNEEN
jgi:hypothetical protein